MSSPTYGRFHLAEAPSVLRTLHVHDGVSPLKEVDHEPKVAVLDQSDLLAQGIRCSTFIPGAQDADALGSCTANATVSALSNLLSPADFSAFIKANSYVDVVSAEKAAISFYHACTDQTGISSTTQRGFSTVSVLFAKRRNNRRRALATTSGAEMPQGQNSPTTSPAWRKWMAELSLCLVKLTESNRRTVCSYKIAGTAAPGLNQT